MSNLVVDRVMKIISPLSFNTKLELMAEISENLRQNNLENNDNESKQDTLASLFGAWKDIEDNIIEDIYSARSNSSREISFD